MLAQARPKSGHFDAGLRRHARQKQNCSSSPNPVAPAHNGVPPIDHPSRHPWRSQQYQNDRVDFRAKYRPSDFSSCPHKPQT
jgi:hypothetical protein